MKFELSDKQIEQSNKWMKKIKKKTKHSDNSCYATNMVYTFEHTGIGPICKVYYRGHQLDLTDVSTW